MSGETLGGYRPPEFNSSPEQQESSVDSRFGNKEVLNEALEHGNVVIKGRIEDFHDVAPHRNVVELAYVRHETVLTRNKSSLVEVEENGVHFEAVFKPVSGEDKKFHNENNLGHDYSREVASYLVSEHFGFDLVPPTVLKTIRGEVGSLQYFLPDAEYATANNVMHTIEAEQIDAFMMSPDVAALSVFDWITANADRHGDNYMLAIDENRKAEMRSGGPKIVAIDNGASFNDIFYRLKANRKDIPGPYQFLTTNNVTGTMRQTPIPTELLEKIQLGLDNKDKLDKSLAELPDIDPKEISLMWQRVEGLLTTKTFLSGPNYKQLTNYPRPV